MKVVVVLLIAVASVFASTTANAVAFDGVADALVAWMQGSLGYTISLLGILFTLLSYKLWDVFPGYRPIPAYWVGAGILVSIMAGALVGITGQMFGLGSEVFNG